jgi:hypothetical protein
MKWSGSEMASPINGVNKQKKQKKGSDVEPRPNLNGRWGIQNAFAR